VEQVIGWLVVAVTPLMASLYVIATWAMRK